MFQKFLNWLRKSWKTLLLLLIVLLCTALCLSVGKKIYQRTYILYSGDTEKVNIVVKNKPKANINLLNFNNLCHRIQ